jgi:hypothetical protein
MTTGRSSRKASKRLAAAAGAILVLVAGTPARAHRLDEYLQASRLAIDPDRVSIELDLTPGVAIAAMVIREIDADANGSIDAAEARSYSQRALSSISLGIDGVPLDVSVVERAYPSIEAMKEGQGTIRLGFAATLPRLASGTHRLHYRNAHRTDIGVYLANAMMPMTDRISVNAQHRDVDQRELVIEYELRGGTAAPLSPWIWPLVVSGLAVGAVVLWRRLPVASQA